MELHTREYLISRVVLGIVKLKVRPGLTLIVNSPTIEQNYEAQEVYQDTFEQAYFEGLPVQEEVYEMLVENGLWSPVEDGIVKKIAKDIEDFKIQLYKSLFDSKAQVSIRRILTVAKEKQIELHRKRHIYDHTSCQGVASYSRSCWIIENCTTDNEKKPYNFNGYSISQVLGDYQSSILEEYEVRELARSDPWRSIWSTSKKEGTLFGKKGITLTDEQKHLIMWSSMYDNIAESPDSPSDEVLEDDDMLDGWLLIQRREREKDKKEKSAESVIGNTKISGADEVFVAAKSQEDIDRINELNDMRAAIIRERRLSQIKDTEGGVKHQDLEDVKQDLVKEKIEQAKSRAR